MPATAGTDLLHGEDMSGFAPLMFSAQRLERQRAAYEAMNRALEQRLNGASG